MQNNLSVAAHLEAGMCIGSVAPVPDSINEPPSASIPIVSVESLLVLDEHRAQMVLNALALEQGDLTDQQFAQLVDLVQHNADLFALQDRELGYTDVVKHSMDTGDHHPIRQPVRCIPFVYRKDIAKMFRDMEKQGVVRPSCSPWASPVVLVPKKDGTKRFCVDYRKLNGITRKDGYPLPRIDDILDTLGGSQYFTSLDLASGYWQVGMDEESAQKSAFTTHSGLYEFVRMPFGMCNAPATFQRLMEIVLSDLLWKHCFTYLDDVLVCSPTFDDHLHHLHTVFERIRQAGLRLQAKKCQFLKPSVCYLGHVVSKEGICPDPAKTNQIEHYPVNTDVEGVCRFLGLASYYRRFVSKFSKVASPLHLLLKKGVPFSWTVECRHSFESLKRKLISAPVLSYPSFKSHEPFILETDASGRDLGAVLAQKQHDGLVHPIVFASHALSSHERNYSITELETLAVVWAAKLFRPYLLGHACKVITDHAACTSLLNSANLSSKFARWAMVIQELDLTITHRSGKSNRVADALSRSPVSPVEVLQVETTSVDTSTPPAESDIVKLQCHDEEFTIILQFLENGNVPEDQRLVQYLKVDNPTLRLLMDCCVTITL